MELKSGDKLGPYEILSPIGAGGMGEVFKALDTRLDRIVAVKVMPRYIASREDLRARFEREARTVSNLKHPNICVLFDVGKQDGTDFMVLEFLEGETLAARISKGPLPADQSLKYAIQIGDALDRAHRSGVSHRDVKPANVMITRDGCKVLDFGLAKTAPRIIDPDDATLTVAALTSEGTILGTPQYMAPEQYEGKEADARSDIFAFGCVLYEMVTGKRSFEGKTKASLIAAVLGAEPVSMSALVPVTPLALERVVRRCLAKDAEDRYQSMRDVVLELQDITRSAADNPAPTATLSSKPLIAVAATLAVALGFALFALWRSRPVDRPLVRLNVDLGDDVALRDPNRTGSSVAISPDGSRLVYSAGTPRKLFARRFDQVEAVGLSGTEGASDPFFSPDGQWVAFIGDGLKRISLNGGPVVRIAAIEDATFRGASWAEDGSIFVCDYRGLVRIPAGGGSPEILVGKENGSPSLPQLLPGGKALLFSAYSSGAIDEFTIEAMTLADRKRKVVARGGQSPQYRSAPGGAGYLLYVNKATLFATAFDAEKIEARGSAQAILSDVAYTSNWSGQFDVSNTGTLVYRKSSGSGTPPVTLEWIDPNGRKEPLLPKPGQYGSPSLSPEGKRVALVVRAEGGGADIWAYDIQRDAMTRLTFGGAAYSYTRWSPDGQYIVFGVDGKGIFQARADGTGQPRVLTQSVTPQYPWSFTPNGKRLAFDDFGTGNWQVSTVPLEDQGGWLKAGPLEQIKSKFNELNPSFSPDGQWLAYESRESGSYQVYVRAFPPSASGQDGHWQVSDNGGTWAWWSPTAHDLLYWSKDQMMDVSYSVKGGAFVAEKPRVWIARLGGIPVGRSPDGRRVAIVVAESQEAPKQEHEVVFVENFFDELRRKVPVGK